MGAVMEKCNRVHPAPIDAWPSGQVEKKEILPRRKDGPASSSARGYLLTLLGEFVLGQDSPTWTATFLQGLGALGIDERAARQAIARSAANDLLQPERVGRKTRWHLTKRARVLLKEGTERIYSFHRHLREWDGRWIILFVTVPEAQRDARYRLRVRLGWAGFAPLGNGVWICPWVERQAEAEQVLEELALTGAARSFIGEIGHLGDPAAVVAEAWDLPAIEAAYQAFIHSHHPCSHAHLSDEEGFVKLTKLVHSWRHLPLSDPDLPHVLLPKGWSSTRATALFHELHSLWSPAATRWWEEHRYNHV